MLLTEARLVAGDQTCFFTRLRPCGKVISVRADAEGVVWGTPWNIYSIHLAPPTEP